jgi:chlorite dismutase
MTPSTGVGVLHLFCLVPEDADREAVVAAVKAAQGDDHQVITFAVLGHKADVGFMALGADLWRLRQFQAAV